ncbi:hypothetical protein C4561_03770 [candidate division WWE3 bacterium]|jgi:hypothetical protein|uniref:Uncharacterized protein n=1 Tax=candidate division WWE3 bacterium TaxID=2053526 RepID=A0A3A4ZJY5_UNCKA|nr:MAG: hypothetical protein C4561_03770 [candidate division WWE3 bacterium]
MEALNTLARQILEFIMLAGIIGLLWNVFLGPKGLVKGAGDSKDSGGLMMVLQLFLAAALAVGFAFNIVENGVAPGGLVDKISSFFIGLIP